MVISFYIREKTFLGECEIDIVVNDLNYGSYSINKSFIDSFGYCYMKVNYKRFKKDRII